MGIIFRINVRLLPALIIAVLVGFLPMNSATLHAQDVNNNPAADLEWHKNIVAGYYGSATSVLRGAYGNKLYTGEEYFVALPSRVDSLDVLDGLMACRLDENTELPPSLIDLMYGRENSNSSDVEPNDRTFEFWPESGEISPTNNTGPTLGELYEWVVDGDEGDGLFRVIEIKPAGKDGPIFEAYIADVGPWCTEDPYWEDYNRPVAESGLDSRGRSTNRGGIDLSYALAKAIGCTGLMPVDWRWKTIDGAYVVERRPTDWNY